MPWPTSPRTEVRSVTWASATAAAGLAAACVVFGAMAAVLPWWMSVGLLIGAMGAAAMVAFPMLGLIMTMAYAFRVVPAVLAPEIPFGTFKLRLYELSLILTIAGVLLRWARGRLQCHYYQNDIRAVAIASTALIGCILFAILYGRFGGATPSRVLSEGRNYFALLALPVLPFIVGTQTQWLRMTAVLYVMATVVSVYVLAQLLTGVNIMGGRLEDLGLSANTGVMRSLLGTGGMVIAFALFHGYGLIRLRPRLMRWFIPLALLFLMGLMGTYTRSTWLTTAVGALFVAWLYGGVRSAASVGALGTVLVSCALAAGYLVKPLAVEAAVERALGIAEEVQHGASFGWRLRENHFAFQSIADHPIGGVGLGGAYRRVDLAPDAFENSEYFIHNGYLVFPVKMGLVGYIFLITLIWIYLRSVARSARATSTPTRLRRNAFMGVSLAFLLGAFNAPVFSGFHDLLFLSLMVVGSLPLVQSACSDAKHNGGD